MSFCAYRKSDGKRCQRTSKYTYCWQHGGEANKDHLFLLNQLVANAFSLYVKTKNYHWHLAGPHFRDYHLLFDEQANEILSTIDVIAERVRKLGGQTIKSLKHISQLTTLSDDNDIDVSAADMINRLLQDNQTMSQDQQEAIRQCDSNGDVATSNQLQEMLDQTQRRIWFLKEIQSE